MRSSAFTERGWSRQAPFSTRCPQPLRYAAAQIAKVTLDGVSRSPSGPTPKPARSPSRSTNLRPRTAASRWGCAHARRIGTLVVEPENDRPAASRNRRSGTRRSRKLSNPCRRNHRMVRADGGLPSLSCERHARGRKFPAQCHRSRYSVPSLPSTAPPRPNNGTVPCAMQ